MNTGGTTPPPNDANLPDPGASGITGAAELSAAVHDWEAVVIALYLRSTAQLNANFRRAPVRGAAEDALTRADAWLTIPVGATPAARTERLDPGDVERVRQWLADGAVLPRAGIPLDTVLDAVATPQSGLDAILRTHSAADWSLVLEDLLADGRVSAGEAARAVGDLTAQPDAGPAAQWQGLIRQMERAGLPASTVNTVRWQAQCGELGLTRDERRLLASLVGAPPTEPSTGDGAPLPVRVQASLAAKVSTDELLLKQDQKAEIVANSVWLDVLPPGYDALTVNAACVHVNARRLGLDLPTAQTALLLDLRAGRSEDALIATHGADYTALGGKAWQTMGLPGFWIGAHETAAMVEGATALGLYDIPLLPASDPGAPVPVVALSLPQGPRPAGPTLSAPLFNGQPLDPALIAAAPSLRNEDVDTFKHWQVERLSGTKWPGAGGNIWRAPAVRAELSERLGNPDAQGILAIAAKAADQGKLSADELFAVQRWLAADRLGLTQTQLVTLPPLAAGCTKVEAASWLGLAQEGISYRWATMCRRLGVGGSPSDLPVRQALLDAAFAEGLVQQQSTIPAVPPQGVSLAEDRTVAEKPSYGDTTAARPLTESEIAAAPSLPTEQVSLFKKWIVQGLPQREWDPRADGGGLKRQIKAALNNPDFRGLLAIATKAVQEGHLTPTELRQAERGAVLQTFGLTRRVGELLDALTDGATVDEAARVAGFKPNAAEVAVRKVARALDMEQVGTGPEPLAELMAVATRRGLCLEPATMGQLPANAPLSREEIDTAQPIPVELLQVFKDWKVEDRVSADWAVGETAVPRHKAALNVALRYPDARGFAAVAAKALESGQLTPAEFTKAMRFSVATTAGLSRQDIRLLDVLNDTGDIDATQAYLGLTYAQVGRTVLNLAKILDVPSPTVGYTSDTLSNLMQAAFERGFLLEQPRNMAGG